MATRYMFANFDTVEEAASAYTELLDEGFHKDEVSVVATEATQQQFKEETGSDMGQEVGQGAAAGAVTGGLIGLIVSAVPIAIAGLPSLIVIGPIAAALGLTGVAATTTTGAVAGGVIGGLAGLLDSAGIGSDTAEKYTNTIQEGGVILIVPVTLDSEDQTRDMLDKAGAQTIQIGQVKE